ncbi:Metalloenzyme, LuxS/M16 peptidase-like protein [Protomyces lactucae-debilis]|uniref:Cytochrome b-c1 complex subunit 2, mitochondrial n=1 Tax=Protomyces lactucae-debilis TaxID=2754530 RepID=A0A1Y2EQM8_PROLT|nr:Metalloenzyme, LuxS/M16 peptidase-like protein [Protomyces lactucae-debilis]ORY73890.1 Metalloenzyme, LuxS/M16 peptidase-like protein [Protomyces lactucae-debilis]
MFALNKQATMLAARRTMATAAHGSAASSFAVRKQAGILVASRDDGRPTTSLSVVIRAGSRFESSPGVAHLLEKFAFQSTEKRSALRITREAELIGATLSSQITREHIILGAQFLREDLPYFTQLLGEVLAHTKYTHYTLPESVLPLAQVEYKASQHSPPALAADTLHQLAFRRGLGNPLLATPTVPVSTEQVAAYAKQSYVKENIAIVATGVDQARLDQLVSEHFSSVPSGAQAQVSESKYFGGEARLPYRSSIGHFAIGFPGAAASPHVPAEMAVLGALLGGSSSIKWSPGNSILGQAAASVSPQIKALANHGTYTDTGLFSIYIMGPTAQIPQAAKASVNALKQIASKVSAEDLKRAIAQAKFAAYAAAEERTLSAEAVGRSLLAEGKAPAVEETVQALEKVTADKVQKAAKKLLDNKPSVAAIGETHKMPFFDEL